ncbi:hypothetical protein LAZ67_7001425 [Cordylochernes scorpioides]|uniref:Reverse transcriptase domain-containing protein n=1 Tax=Cordylochernes scorpioides TaxID=51811 RepID=A0ABY6KNT5_9ARAC|nr:hypothetical protein LAZ67_7001425 [Cordylochernes scorpioides]
MHGDQVESNRLDRILVPAGVLVRVSIYATSHYHLSDHRLVLLQVGPPTTAVSSPTQPRLAAMLHSGLALEHLAGYIRELEEDTAHVDDDGTFWDSYVYRARRYIAAQLEASSIRADYPSLPDLARAIRLRRPVSVIRDEQDNIIEGPELRRRAFATFQPRFARPASDPAAGAAFIASSAPTTTRELSEEDPLHRPDISPSEIANAIEHLPRGKAPGWDGLPCELLVAFSEDFFAEAMARVFAATRLRGALPPSTRRSSICLVPKARGGRGLDGYRPVALPSADYRVLAAILYRRLKPHLRTLVPECQTYAVPGRSPSWNIAMVTDAVEEATALGSPLAVMGVDLESAFDSLGRGFLESLLTSLRLPPAFRAWINIVYAGADATIRARGFYTAAFPLLNGLRQGCAVSAALLSIATGPLLRRLELTLGVGNVIAYADDIVLLFHRDGDFERVATVFEEYKQASGVGVNLRKSAGLWCGAWRNRGDSPLGASWSTTSIRILGLDIFPGAPWTPFTRGLSLVGRARAANTLMGSTIQHHLHGHLPSPPTIAKLQARLARFVWGPDHTAWLPANVMVRPVTIGGLGLHDLATQLQLACLKGVQVALCGGRNAFSWLVESGEAWIHPPPDGTRLQPRRLRLLKLWEEASNILSLNHRALPTAQLLDLPIIGGCRFLRPPNLLAPARWRGARVRDLIVEENLIARPTRSALADAAALGAFCRRLTSENAVGFGAESTPSSSSLAAAVVLRGTATPFLNGLTTRSARRALDRPRLAATPISRFLARWTPTINPPSRIDWASLRRCAYSGHEADAALKLALHALPHPAHPASVGPSCPACGSIDHSLGHRYWCCRSIRPLIREAFNIIGRPPDLQAWIFGGSGLEDDALYILASAKLQIYRYFVQVGLGEAVEDPLIALSRTLQRRESSFTSKPLIAELPSLEKNKQQGNLNTQRKQFTLQEWKKFEESRKETYEKRSKNINSTIQFTALSDCSAEEHLSSIAKIIGHENIHSVGKMNGQAVVSVANGEQAQLLINNGFAVRGNTIYPTPLFNPPKKYIISGILAFIPDEEVNKALAPFGEILSVRPLPFPTENSLFKHLSSLRREVVLKRKESTDMPAIIPIVYMQRTFKIFVGEDITCLGCKRHGHIKSKCPFNPEIRNNISITYSEAINPTALPAIPGPSRETVAMNITARNENYEDETSSICSIRSMASTQLQKELMECEEGENPETEKIIATIYKMAGISRAAKVQQQLALHPDLETKISCYLEKQEDFKSKTYNDLKSDQRRALNPNKPGEQRGSQQQKRPTGLRKVPPQEFKATRKNIDEAKASQNSSTHENYIFVELCPEIPDYTYLWAIPANSLVVDGLEIEGTSFKVFPFRKRAERIVVANLPGFVEDITVVKALSPYGKVTSIAPILFKMGEFTFTDGRREAFILLNDGIKLDRLPTRLDIKATANCPALARQTISSRQTASPTDARPPSPPPPPQQPRQPSPAPAATASPIPPAETSTEATAIPSAPQPAEPKDHAQPAPAAHPAPLAAQRAPGDGTPLLDCETTNEEEFSTSSTSSTSSQKRTGRAQLEKHLDRLPTLLIVQSVLQDLGRAKTLDLLSSRKILKESLRSLPDTQVASLLKLTDTILAAHPAADSTVQRVLTRVRKPLEKKRRDKRISSVYPPRPLPRLQRCCPNPSVAIPGSGLACVFGPGVAVLQQRILWPGHIALATIDVHGKKMTDINVHLAHEPRVRNQHLELLAATAAQEEEGACWIFGDFNIRDRDPSSSSSSYALAALLDLAALVDVATQFDVAHLPTRVARHGDQVESSRLDRILVPAGVLDRVSIYATSHYHLSDHRLVLLQVGPPTIAVGTTGWTDSKRPLYCETHPHAHHGVHTDVQWSSLRRGAFTGHESDIALRLVLHALPHPAHPASARPSCAACGSRDLSLAHGYWSCRCIRPLIREGFSIMREAPDLRGWLFGTGLDRVDPRCGEIQDIRFLCRGGNGRCQGRPDYVKYVSPQVVEAPYLIILFYSPLSLLYLVHLAKLKPPGVGTAPRQPSRPRNIIEKIKVSRQMLDQCRSKAAAGTFDQMIYLEYSPEFTPVDIRALENKLGKNCVVQLGKDVDIIRSLRPYCQMVSITPAVNSSDGYTWLDLKRRRRLCPGLLGKRFPLLQVLPNRPQESKLPSDHQWGKHHPTLEPEEQCETTAPVLNTNEAASPPAAFNHPAPHLQAIVAAAVNEGAWVFGDLNISEESASDIVSGSVGALAELLDRAYFGQIKAHLDSAIKSLHDLRNNDEDYISRSRKYVQAKLEDVSSTWTIPPYWTSGALFVFVTGERRRKLLRQRRSNDYGTNGEKMALFNLKERFSHYSFSPEDINGFLRGYTLRVPLRKLFRGFEYFFASALRRVLEASQLYGVLPSSMRRSKMFLIAEPHGGIGLAGLRALSLPTTDYRVLSGVLYWRLRPHLRDIVPECQSYHVPDEAPLAVVATDLESAFDTLNRSFLVSILLSVGLPSVFVEWILLLFAGAEAKVRIEGIGRTPLLYMLNGVSQGCTASAAFFTIFTGPLMFRLEQILTYADDIVLLIREVGPLEVVKKIFEAFRRASGIRVNFGESQGLWCGRWSNHTDQDQQLQELLERDIAKWFPFVRGLSLAGRAKTVNSLVLSAIYYYLQAYLPSEITFAMLQTRLARFL